MSAVDTWWGTRLLKQPCGGSKVTAYLGIHCLFVPLIIAMPFWIYILRTQLMNVTVNKSLGRRLYRRG